MPVSSEAGGFVAIFCFSKTVDKRQGLGNLKNLSKMERVILISRDRSPITEWKSCQLGSTELFVFKDTPMYSTYPRVPNRRFNGDSGGATNRYLDRRCGWRGCS
jgi:hypothetical protein